MTLYSLKRTIPALLLAFAALGFVAVPAHAQATRTWVSGVGDDANPCSRTAPCKTFAGAISKTAPAGEINVLDPGGFGAVTITKSITIRSDHIEAGVLVSGTNGIVISAASTDFVNLEGLDFDGTNLTGLTGVEVLQASRVTITNCEFRDFATGVAVIPTSAPVTVLVKDSRFYNNTTGAQVKSSVGTAAATGFFDHVTVFGKANQTAVQSAGSHGTVFLNDSTIVGNQIGIGDTTGSFFSFGNNRVINNQSNGTPNQSIVPLE